jgi:hypothetical protein
VNQGTISASAHAIKATNFQNPGVLFASTGTIVVSNNTGTANFGSGQVIAGTDFKLQTTTLSSTNGSISAGSTGVDFNGQPTFKAGVIYLYVGNGFNNYDTNSQWRCINGFQLFKTDPGSWNGDLLGTKVESFSRPFTLTPHIWTAADYGADRRGYTNNAAVRILTLDGGTTGKFLFSGPTAPNNSAIYVDYLELKNYATNYSMSGSQRPLQIDSNFTIYFASANVPESKLDGAQNGRLRWVQNFAGPNSSTNVALRNGGFITVNRALAQSTTTDSDADGTPNAFDTFPFDGPTVSASVTTQGGNNVVTLSWNGAASTTYTVDYTTNLVSWQVLTNVTTGASAGTVTVQDTVPLGTIRFYRVRYSP